MHATVLALALSAGAPQMEITHESFELDNGLTVLVHEDHSDPVVAVMLYYHVGSGREEPGRSGFAHLFEHMMFQGSANVGDDAHFRLVQEAGGTLNGSTTRDRTNYYETLPSNQLELALWLEADRMGFLLPAMTQEKLDNQRDVVKNERRQRYENRPYGTVSEVLAPLLYPEGHPYSWTTIGSMEDLSAASLEDVAAFFRRWYGPNNATLVVAGDVDPGEVRTLVEKWFGPLPRGPQVTAPEPRPAELRSDVREVIEDRVELPQLTTIWPTIPLGHPDEAALALAADFLSANKSAVLDRALTIDEEVASYVAIGHSEGELAGDLRIDLRPRPGVTLDELEERLHGLIAGAIAEGVSPERLEVLVARREGQTIRSLETVTARANRMARDRVFRGDGSWVTAELEALRAVTPEDVTRVLETYLVGKPRVVVSVVPEGRLELAASGRSAVQIAGEDSLDRTVQPAAAGALELRAPDVWHARLSNGVRVTGSRYSEVPLARVKLSVPAGRLHETVQTLGVSSMTAALLEEGTEELSGTELLDAFDGLGASFAVGSDDDEITLALSVPDRSLEPALELLEDMLLRPRFSEEDFERLRRERLVSLETRGDRIAAVTGDAWRAVMFGTDTVAGKPGIGTPESTEAMHVTDVRAFWRTNARADGARLLFIGSREPAEVEGLLAGLVDAWPAREGGEAIVASKPEPLLPEATTIFLVDKPGAPQSEVRVGHAGVSSLHPDYYRLMVLNHMLGGAFTSRLNLNLREDKGYTYGARSSFAGGAHTAPFTASAAVRTDATAASVAEFTKEIAGIRDGVTAEELAFARNALEQALPRQYESTAARMALLDNVSRYGWVDDYPLGRLEVLRSVTADELKALAREHLHADRLAILVVGDAASVRGPLEELGLGPVVELDATGAPVRVASDS
jgi:zinc protease